MQHPESGDVFREYIWYKENGDAGGSLRIGGNKRHIHPDRGWNHNYIIFLIRYIGGNSG
ncbi:hypothetical protein GF312_23025 [Candidatus Poribacteria bacterium]|nr:hypothetical protein [Candidatus Poribacteria bacterium]